MTSINLIARPYAKAAYEFALARKELPAWGKLLQAATEFVQQPLVSKALESSRVSAEQWFALSTEVLSPYLNEERKNFLRLLAENKRLSVLPIIAELFKEYEALNNQATEVQVTTAVPLDEKYQRKLTDKLTQVLKHHVTLRCDVDEHILGGAVVRAGDKVIDGSIRGQLTRLLEFAIR